MTEQTANAAQADAAATSQADTASDDQPQRTDQASEPTSVDDLPKWVRDEIKAARKEAATYRTRVKEFEDAQKTEAERQAEALQAAEARATQYQQRVRDLTAQSVVTDAARDAGAIAPSLIYRAVRGDLEFDDDGNPTNVDAVLADLRKTSPEAFRAAGGSGDGGKGAGLNGKPINTINELLRAEMRR